MQVWQSLLLVQAQLTQGHGHLTTSADFTNRTIPLVSDFLKHTQATSCAQSQSIRLTFVAKLWRVMTNVFPSSWLTAPAAGILTRALSVRWLLGEDDVFRAWGLLTAQLVSAGWRRLIEKLGHHDDSHAQNDFVADAFNHSPVNIDRQLWSLLAENWQEMSGEKATEFLVIPFA